MSPHHLWTSPYTEERSNTFVNLHFVIVYMESAADAVVYQGKNLFPLISHLSLAVLRNFKNIHLYAWCQLMGNSSSWVPAPHAGL